MSWGTKFHSSISLRVAAVGAVVFWFSQFAFVGLELSFDQGDPAAQWWLGPFADRIIFVIWASACVATISALLALRADRLGRTVLPPTTKQCPSYHPQAKESQCSAL